ncbi:MAG: PsbP-related protein [Clostridia bacterium]|nr:PsbP-related protein [Clostridia bacterium]
MKKNTVYTAIAAMVASVAISGCSTTKDVTPTIAPVQKPAAVQTVLGDYALLAGHILYQDANNAYSIQLPENAEINDENPDNIIITIATEAGHTNTVNIKYAENVQIIDTETQLMDSLKDDDSIDITGFFVLNKDGAYEGYKYTFTAMNDSEFKSIKSIYFSDDRSAYIITASSPDGGDDINMTNLNTIVDTFINYR